MPLYQYECLRHGLAEDAIRSIAERHEGPICVDCMQKKHLVVSAVRGIVKFPAAGGHEYVSAVSGKHITTERGRREDLKRSGCRPYEGFEQEKKEADRWQAAEDKKLDAKLHDNVSKAYYEMAPEKRAILKGAA